MKKYQFSLAKMRSYKDQLLEREKNALMSLRAQQNQAQQRLEDLQQQMVDAQTRFQNRMREGTDVGSIQLYEMQKRTILQEQQALRMHIQMLETKVERQRKVVVALSQEVSGLDKLEQSQREEYQKMLAKDNEAMIEEFVTFRMLQNREAERV